MDWRKRKRRRRIMQHYGCSCWRSYKYYLRLRCVVERIKQHERNQIKYVIPSIEEVIDSVPKAVYVAQQSFEIEFVTEDQYKALDPDGYATCIGKGSISC